MAERIRWRQKHDALAAENTQLQQDVNRLQMELEHERAAHDEAESEIAELKKAVERARIEGMHDATGLILRSER